METTWLAGTQLKTYPKLDRDIEVDALIIGGGITGTTALYLLAQAGVKVALIDKSKLSESTTAYTTAFLTNVIDTGLVELEKIFGKEKAKAVWLSHKEAIERIEKIITEEKIECEFIRCSNYMYANDVKELEAIKDETKLADLFGFDMEMKDDKKLKINNSGYAVLKNQAKFHPLKYLQALREKALENGGLIFENTEALEIEEGQHGRVKTAHGTISANKILVATYNPFNKPRELFAHKGMYVSYVMELKLLQNSLPEGIYEDESNPYHYFRVDRMDGHDRIILGGEDHRREAPLDAKKAFASLEEHFKKILPMVSYKIVRNWRGPILETVDGLAYIGIYDENHPSRFVATGFSGNGMTYGMLAGIMFKDFVTGNENPWTQLYNPRRKITPRALWEKGKDYIEEFARGYGRTVFKNPDA